MDALTTVMAVVIVLLVLGAAAVNFGADSRDSTDDGRLPATPAI